ATAAGPRGVTRAPRGPGAATPADRRRGAVSPHSLVRVPGRTAGRSARRRPLGRFFALLRRAHRAPRGAPPDLMAGHKNLPYYHSRNIANCRVSQPATHALRTWAEAKVWAEWKGGHVLREIERSVAGRPAKNSYQADINLSRYEKALKEAGFAAITAHRWQVISYVPEPSLEVYF